MSLTTQFDTPEGADKGLELAQRYLDMADGQHGYRGDNARMHGRR